MIAGLKVHNTRDVFNEHTRIAACVMAKVKEGKTTLGATLDKLTRKHHGKPTLFITAEKSSGSGLETLKELGVDYVVPKNLKDLRLLIAALETDKTYAGVVPDSFHEIYNNIVKPHILDTPCREKNPVALEARELGVLTDSDYNKSAEIVRRLVADLIGLTALSRVELRKHVVLTINEKPELDEDRRTVRKIWPDLPGQSRVTLAGMVPIIGRLKLQRKVVKNEQTGKNEAAIVRTFDTTSGGKYATCDRMGLLPAEAPADFCEMYEKFWLPQVNKAAEQNGQVVEAA